MRKTIFLVQIRNTKLFLLDSISLREIMIENNLYLIDVTPMFITSKDLFICLLIHPVECTIQDKYVYST